MKKFNIIFLLAFVANFTYAQKLPPTTAKKVNFTKFKQAQRQSFYPFNKAVKIALVSFPASSDTTQKGNYIPHNSPILLDTFLTNGISQIKYISAQQIVKLTDIIFNTCDRWTISETTKLGCYNPRNAIIFLDSSNKVFEYVEICLECHYLRTSNTNVRVPDDDCNYLYQDLGLFLKSLGLKTTNKDSNK
jgi:hypothetical protein